MAKPAKRFIDPSSLVRRRLGDRKPPEWSTAVISFRGAIGTRDLVEAFAAKPHEGRVFWGFNSDTVQPRISEASVDGRRVGIVGECVWGGPQAAIVVEELAALGVPLVVGFGCCGALAPGIPRGAQTMVTKALLTDGTSRAYTRRPVGATRVLKFACFNAAQRLNVKLHAVTAVTIDAPYRETPAQAEAWRAKGAHVVHMESAPLYAAAAACGLQALWIGHVSGRLVGDRWEDWHDGREDMSAVSARLCRELMHRAIVGPELPS